MKYDISVIIPAYNNEKTVKKCVESIKNKNITAQIIIINDGSTDNTLKEIKKIKDVEIINSNYNQGPSISRNKGIKKIKGEYFTFLDADDCIKENMYEILLQKARKNKLDICGCNYIEVSKEKIKSKYNYDGRILDNESLMKEMLTDKISLVVWDKIYKTEKFRKIKFNEKLRINEDYDYTIRCFNKAEKAMFINEYLYNYCHNKESLTNNYTCKQIKENNYINYIEKNIKTYPEYKLFECKENLKKVHLYSKCIDKENRYKYIKENTSQKKLKQLLNYDISKITKVEIRILLKSIKLHLFLYPIYQRVKNIIRR